MNVPLILSQMRVCWLNLVRDRAALALTFILPVAFFSIFAAIFGSMGGGADAENPIALLVADQDGSKVSSKLVAALDKDASLRVTMLQDAGESPNLRDEAQRRVRAGDFPVALVVPEGFSDSFPSFTGEGKAIELIHDESNPIASYTVQGLLQASAMTAAPELLMDAGLEQLETFGGALTPEQQKAVEDIHALLENENEGVSGAADSGTDTEDDGGFAGLIPVTTTAARHSDDEDAGERSGIVAYFAAGIGVMFLLFSMAGAGASLLEEENTGMLERLLGSRVTMTSLLASRWLFFGAVGFVQVTLMFVWGALVFGLDLFTPFHISGFVLMTLATVAAASAFGILLAVICRSAAQLQGISTIVILVMSALGGSMVPRMVAPFLETTSKFTFNGWALDGYLKVFWHDDPDRGVFSSLLGLAPQLAVLGVLTAVLLVVARLLARRWETV